MIQFNEYLIGEDDKPVENLTERHQLVLIILDLSNSMAPYQQELERALRALVEDLKGDAATRGSVEICVVGVGGEPRILIPFGPLYTTQLPVVQVGGGTPLYGGIEMGYQALMSRYATLKKLEVPMWASFCFILSDGKPTDNINEGTKSFVAQQRADHAKVICYPIGIGPEAQNKRLAALNTDGKVYHSGKYESLAEFFRFISASASAVGNSHPGVPTMLPTPERFGFQQVSYSTLIDD